MRFEEWEPVYLEICEYFSFERSKDEEAAKILSNLSDQNSIGELTALCKGKTVTVCGNAPCLKDQTGIIRGTVIAADAAAEVLVSRGIRPDIIVTDLDGIDEYAIDLNAKGTILVVHAHGDNIPRLRSWVPRFTGPLVLTTQARPFGHLHNFGGFTDGDRAIYMARELGADMIILAGFDLDDPEVTPMKKGKLFWARRLITDIGYEC